MDTRKGSVGRKDIKPAAVLIALTISIVLISGCLGSSGDEGGDGGGEVPTSSAQTQQAGSINGLAQSVPEEVQGTVTVTIDNDSPVRITFNISVEDGDANTNPDNVESITVTAGEGGGNNTATITGGNTPLTKQHTVEWDGKEPLPTTYSFDFTVTLEASDDQWPGPLIWRGIPDRGVSILIEVNYDYLDESLE